MAHSSAASDDDTIQGINVTPLVDIMLVLIIIFIQKRPQGIFAMKGRSAEA